MGGCCSSWSWASPAPRSCWPSTSAKPNVARSWRRYSLLRRLWSGDVVDHDGLSAAGRPSFSTPVQMPLEMWLGGQCRRHCDAPDAWATGGSPACLRPPRPQRNASASRPRGGSRAHHRSGTLRREPHLQPWSFARGSGRTVTTPSSRPRSRDLIPQWGLARTGRRMAGRRVFKFLLRPAVPPTDWTAELETLAADILERQT